MFPWELLDDASSTRAEVLRAWHVRLQAQIDWGLREYAVVPTVRLGVIITLQQQVSRHLLAVSAASEHDSPAYQESLLVLKAASAATKARMADLGQRVPSGAPGTPRRGLM